MVLWSWELHLEYLFINKSMCFYIPYIYQSVTKVLQDPTAKHHVYIHHTGKIVSWIVHVQIVYVIMSTVVLKSVKVYISVKLKKKHLNSLFNRGCYNISLKIRWYAVDPILREYHEKMKTKIITFIKVILNLPFF